MTRRALIGLVVVLVIAASGAAVLLTRRPTSSSDAPMPTAAQSPAVPATVPPSSLPRGEVEIDPTRQQLIGIRTAPVEKRSVAASVRTTGVVRADETRQTDVNVKLDGWIRELYVDYTGQAVQRGQRLFTLYSPELFASESELLLALKNRNAAQASAVDDARRYGDQLVEAARRRLVLWDVPPDQIRAVEESGRALETMTVSAPATGVVLDKQAVAGMRVTAGQMLYRIVDLSSVWVEGDLYEQDLALVRVGQPATITLDAYPGRAFAGRAIYIVPTVNEQTRTGRVRFQLSNPGGVLKPGMFANVELRGGDRVGLTVPANAVLDSGTEQVVFVAEGQGRFTPRHVKVGRRLADGVEIVEGLKEGDQVAESATFFLDSESQLRAGLQNYEAPQGAGAAPAPAGPAPSITFRSQTEPAKTGENVFEVTVKDSAGSPIADGDVSVTLFMPAMPTMNMPAMRTETKLAPVGGGLYRGPGQVLMAGRWEVTVSVVRNGQRIGGKQLALVAK
jgi:RND family efflux transporter MFP subunit